MKFSQLRSLIEVARAGSIQSAAQSMAMSQPALSKTISSLEREMGAPLLERSSRGVSLTAFGEIVLKRSQVIQKEMDRLREEVRWFNDDMSSSLRVGLTPLAAGPIVSGAVVQLRDKYPAIDVKLFELRPHQILKGLQDGSLDLGLITHYGDMALPGFETFPIMQFATTLVIGGARSTAPVRLEDLMDEEWIDTEIAEDVNYISNLFAESGLPYPSKVLRCTSVFLCVDLSMRLGAISYMAEIAARFFTKEIEAGLLTQLNLSTPLPTMNILLLHKETDLLSPAAREFAMLVRHGAK